MRVREYNRKSAKKQGTFFEIYFFVHGILRIYAIHSALYILPFVQITVFESSSSYLG